MRVTVDDSTAERPADGPTAGTVTTGTENRRSTRYRYLLPLVSELDEPVTVDRLVDPMYEWEHDLCDGEKSWFDVHEELFLVDLPVLDQAGFVEFDPDRGLVSATG